MHIQISTSFIASTAVPMIKTVFDVYAKQRFEVEFTLKDDCSKKVRDQNLSKVVKTLILLEKELSEAEYKVFHRRFIEQFEQYAFFMFDFEQSAYLSCERYEFFVEKLKVAIEAEKAKQEKRALKLKK